MHSALVAVGQCAKRAAAVNTTGSSPDHLERVIGLGTCRDWLAWGLDLRKVDFKSARKRNSQRAKSFLESTRFVYTWTGANALFCRDSILGRLHPGPLPSSELDRFRILLTAAALHPPLAAALAAPLHTTLELVRTPRSFPWLATPTVRVLDIIYFKYTPTGYRARGQAARAIQAATCGARTVASLDLPVLLYSVRNWILHGALADTSFRGSPAEFQHFASSATKALSVVIEGAARRLLTVI